MVFFLAEAQLSTSGIDIVTFFASNGGADTGLKKSAAEEVDRFFGGALVGQAFDLVIGDEVNLGEKAAGVLGEESRLLGGVIDAGEKDVFEKDLFFARTDKDVAGLEEAIEGETFVDGHNLIADSVAGGVEGEGEAELKWVVGEFLDLGGEAAGGDGDMACAHTDVGGGDEEIEGGEEMGEVG